MSKFDFKKWIAETKYGNLPPHSNYAKQPVNEELATAAAGFVALVSAAGGLSSLQMKMENPEAREKNPKLAMFLDVLDALGSAASSAKRGGTTAGGVNEQDEEPTDEELVKIEDELESMFDIKDDCPVPSADTEEMDETRQLRKDKMLAKGREIDKMKESKDLLKKIYKIIK